MPFFYRDVMLTSDGKGHYLLHFTPRWSCELSNLQTWQLCSFFLAVERVQKNVCRHDLPKFQLLETQCNECYSCWCTMDSCNRVLKIVFEFSVSLYSRFNFLPLLNASIEGNVKKTTLERICEWNVVLWNIPSSTPLGQKFKVRKVFRTSRRRNQTGTRILWFQFWIPPERPLQVPPDKGNEGAKRDWRQKQISGKIDALVFWKFYFWLRWCTLFQNGVKFCYSLVFIIIDTPMPDFKLKISFEFC